VSENPESADVSALLDDAAARWHSVAPMVRATGRAELRSLPGGALGFVYPGPRDPSPGVVVVGGSEGGIGYARRHARMLAAIGFMALALGYFGGPGQPATLCHIPLERFDLAIDWFRHQAGVDSERLFAMGTSRGTEAVLLAAAHAPGLLSGVAALVPSNVVVGGWPGAAAAWTRGGRVIPYSETFGPSAADPAAVIPVERIRAPLFLAGAGRDRVWPSAAMVSAIAARRAADGRPRGDVTLLYPTAGHEIGDLAAAVGRTAVGDPLSATRLEIFEELVRFLSRAPDDQDGA
jgi:dienelactone hydrolase